MPFIFFSLSQSKRPQYILPLMPAIALFVASRWNARMTKAAAIALLALGVLLSVALPFVHLRAEYASAARGAAIAIGVVAIVCGIAALSLHRYAVIALSVPILMIPLATNPLMQSLATRRSEKALAMAIASHVSASRPVVGVEAFTGSMEFYLQRPIVVVSPDGEEFTSNYIIRHYSAFAGKSNLQAAIPVVPGVFIVRGNDAANRARIEARGGTRIAEDARYVAYTIAR